MAINQGEVVQLTADIVSAFVTNNKVEQGQLSKLIEDVHLALVRAPAAAAEPEKPNLVPAVPIKKSVGQDFIVCLEDGKRLKMLKRYLQTRYNMTPAEYRQRWGLPGDYPMVAPAYAERRSTLALQNGLGRKPAARSTARKTSTRRTTARRSTPRSPSGPSGGGSPGGTAGS